MCPFALLDLHLFESRLREEDYLLIKTKYELINTEDHVNICRRVSLPYWCMGEQYASLHHVKRKSIMRKEKL